MASLTQLTWVWVNSGSWWWTGRPLACCSPWGHKALDTNSELNWTETSVRSILGCTERIPVCLSETMNQTKQKNKTYLCKYSLFNGHFFRVMYIHLFPPLGRSFSYKITSRTKEKQKHGLLNKLLSK